DKIRDRNYTAVQAVNAFANYFKHRDEWKKWNDPSRKNVQKRTQRVIQDLGAKESNHENLEIVLRLLAIEPNEDFHRLGYHLEDWVVQVGDHYHKEITKLLRRKRSK